MESYFSLGATTCVVSSLRTKMGFQTMTMPQVKVNTSFL
jgi:hypothetical protein